MFAKCFFAVVAVTEFLANPWSALKKQNGEHKPKKSIFCFCQVTYPDSINLCKNERSIFSRLGTCNGILLFPHSKNSREDLNFS